MFRSALTTLAVFLVASAALAEPLTTTEPETVDGASIMVLDGDTIALPSRERIRIHEIDTPDIAYFGCERELVLGLRAKARLAELLRAGPVTIERQETDRFHRTLARLRLADGRLVGDILMAEGIAIRYQPGREAREERLARWCASAPLGELSLPGTLFSLEMGGLPARAEWVFGGCRRWSRAAWPAGARRTRRRGWHRPIRASWSG
jgi:micrococcal nuclease